MPILVPNVIDSDVFEVQAAVDESTLGGERVTWRRVGGQDVPGVVVAEQPTLRFPKDLTSASAPAEVEAIDNASSADDADAWRTAARIWLDYTEVWFKTVSDDVWKQLSEWGAIRPEELAPNRQSLVNSRTFGSLEILATQGIAPKYDSWPAYFNALRGAIPSMRVTQAIVTQMALRAIAWMFQSLVSGGDQDSPARVVDVCDLAKAWRATPADACAKKPQSDPVKPKPGPTGTRWSLAGLLVVFGGVGAALGIGLATVLHRRAG